MSNTPNRSPFNARQSKLSHNTRECLARIDRKLTVKRRRDRTFYAEIGRDWYHVKNDDAVQRGDLKKLAPQFKAQADPDLLQRCLRVYLAEPEWPDATAWEIRTGYVNPYPSEPYRSLNLLNEYKKDMRRESSKVDPNRKINGLNRSNNINVTVLRGDCRMVLLGLPDKQFHCCVTSPPYHGQRDFEHESQIGTEDSHLDYVYELVKVFDEVKRVLRDDGTVWLNIDDRWAAGGRKVAISDPRRIQNVRVPRKKADALPDKNLMLIPERLMIGLQNAGWRVRSKTIWMPAAGGYENVRDRPVHSYETVLMLTKNSRYYYNAEAAREPSIYKRQHNSQRRRAGAPPLQRADKNLTDVWMFATESHISEHSATFPRELVERCLRISCPPGGHVLDPFGGSGTTSVVAKSLGMASTMIDLKAEYCEFAEQRISATSDPDQTFEAAAN